MYTALTNAHKKMERPAKILKKKKRKKKLCAIPRDADVPRERYIQLDFLVLSGNLFRGINYTHWLDLRLEIGVLPKKRQRENDRGRDMIFFLPSSNVVLFRGRIII